MKTCKLCGEDFLDFHYGITLIKVECPNGHTPMHSLTATDLQIDGKSVPSIIDFKTAPELKASFSDVKVSDQFEKYVSLFMDPATSNAAPVLTEEPGNDPYTMDFDKIKYEIKFQFAMPTAKMGAIVNGTS